jgi:hypothetical protein
MSYLKNILKVTKLDELIKENGIKIEKDRDEKKREHEAKQREHENEHHKFSDNHHNDNWTY